MERLKIDNTADFVILGMSELSRMYYPSTDVNRPVCWSLDTTFPEQDVPEAQAKRCIDCLHSVKSTRGQACRFSQRLAVVQENDWSKIMQLQVSSISIFGNPKHGDTPLQGYIKYLQGHNTAPHTVITRAYQDTYSELPKFFFKPVRPLDEGELEHINALLNSGSVEGALSFSLSNPTELTFAEEAGFTYSEADATTN